MLSNCESIIGEGQAVMIQSTLNDWIHRLEIRISTHEPVGGTGHNQSIKQLFMCQIFMIQEICAGQKAPLNLAGLSVTVF
jgi:hypothetical protein